MRNLSPLRPVAVVAFCALAASTVAQATAQAPIARLDPQNPLYKRMIAVNAAVRSYRADVHLDVALKSFPYISPSLDGNVYYKKPDREAVVFETVPALASQFKKVYPKVDPPRRWLALYDVGVVGDENGATSFRLVPKRNGRVERIDVRVDDSSATIKSYAWTYKDGGTVSFDQTYTSRDGAFLVAQQTGHVDLPSYKADVVSNFKNYRLNVPIDDTVFAER
ncbi:MAG: hypothetical protein NVSMB21_23320 [Vulcanimicrobiaceae bacterium]